MSYPGYWADERLRRLELMNKSSADRGDAAATLVPGVDAGIQRWATALTANRAVTLSTVGAKDGDMFRIVRTGLGAFTMDVGGLKTLPSGAAAFCEVAFDGNSQTWKLVDYGAL